MTTVRQIKRVATLFAVIESLRNGYDFDNLNAHSTWLNYDVNENNEKLNEGKKREKTERQLRIHRLTHFIF